MLSLTLNNEPGSVFGHSRRAGVHKPVLDENLCYLLEQGILAALCLVRVVGEGVLSKVVCQGFGGGVLDGIGSSL